MAIIALYLAQKCERFGESQSQHSDNFWQRNNRNYWEINLFFGKVLSPLQVWDKPKKDCHTKLKYKIIKLNIWPETIFAILIPILAKTILLPFQMLWLLYLIYIFNKVEWIWLKLNFHLLLVMLFNILYTCCIYYSFGILFCEFFTNVLDLIHSSTIVFKHIWSLNFRIAYLAMQLWNSFLTSTPGSRHLYTSQVKYAENYLCGFQPMGQSCKTIRL